MAELIDRAKEIRDETRFGRNTASRVGELLVDMAALLEGEGTDDWFVEKLRKHIDNDTVYWDAESKVIKAKGGAGGTYLIMVDIDADSVGKCSVTASGDGTSIFSNADKSQYLIIVPVAGTVMIKIVTIEGYQVQSLTVDDVPKGDIDCFTFEGVRENHTMTVMMEVAEENPTFFLVRSDLPDYLYSSTQAVFVALKESYPNGLTQNVMITCMKKAKEKNTTTSWIASLADWNKDSAYYLTIDGVDRLTYDGGCLGGMLFKDVDNVLLRNIAFVNCANYVNYNSPDELSAVAFTGNADRRARNLMIYQCSFDGAYPGNKTKTSRRTISSKYSENVTLLGCNMKGDSGNCILLTDSMYVSLIKNNIVVSTTTGDVGHPSIVTLKNSYSLTVEDNDLSGNNQENFIDLTNVERLYFRRNNVHDAGGRIIAISAMNAMKEVVVDSNLCVGMLNLPIGGWMKEYINLGTAQINNLQIRNNTFYMSGSFYEQNALRGGTVENADIYNNIVINAARVTANAFVFNKVKHLAAGGNIYQAIRGMLYSPNSESTEGYITIDWQTAVDMAKLQAAGYEVESAKIADDIAVVEKQNGVDSYKVTSAIDVEYKADNEHEPFADVEYKEKTNNGNSRGCYNLAGIVIDESNDTSIGYVGEDYNEDRSFNNTAQYSTMADDILVLRHNTLDRMRLVVFTIAGTQHKAMVLGRSGIIYPLPEMDLDSEYVADELYTINIE